jgi:hypothetical protein
MTISFQRLSKRGKGKRRSRFPEGMTERKARATANATANPGILHCVQDDGENPATARATAWAKDSWWHGTV